MLKWPDDYMNKVICGDCLDVMKGMPDGCVDLVVTDPPYGINWACAWRKPEERLGAIAGDKAISLLFIEPTARVLRWGGAVYVFTRWDVASQWMDGLERGGLKIKSTIVWDKVIHGCGDLEGAWAPTHEMIIFAVKGKHKLRGKRPQDIIRSRREMPVDLIHPCQKPESVLLPIIKHSSDCGGVIFDPYTGSGTTAIAAKKLGRRFIGIELDPDYCEIARKRIAQAEEQQDLFRKPMQDKQSDLFGPDAA